MLTARTLFLTVVILVIGFGSFLSARAVVINQAPRTVISNIQMRVANAAGGWNACFHNRQYGPVYGGAARANPDSVISIMAYDLRKGPVRVSGETWPDYWSMSLYQQNSDNYFVVNDLQLGSKSFNFILSQSNQQVDGQNGSVVISPSETGIMLIRRFAKNHSVMRAIRENQDAMYCGRLEN